ncbi:MAG: ATP-dependent DNA helicase [Verrucomicrobia bacterium]|nr:ATP-dependent DNA helicase [Verrucomicrobiota bacterium]
MSKRAIPISVRELVEFVLRAGDLGTDRDFFGPARALEGTRGHQRLQASRPKGYRAEVSLSYQIEAAEFALNISGRVDGILETPGSVLIEEIKTVRGGWSSEPDLLHWAQAKIYAFIYGARHRLERIDVQLTYLDLDSDTVTPFRQTFGAHELSAFFTEVTRLYVDWLEEQIAWWRLRDDSIRLLSFPFPQFRAGQPELMAAASGVLANGGNLFVEAPTGIGKTIAVLFPAVQALERGVITKIFYLTAKTLGRTVAEKAFTDLRAAGLRLRSLTFTAREKLCFNQGQPCDVRTCPYAIGYYDRVRNAVRAALNQETMTRPAIEELARGHQVCPAALCADVSRWVDVVICDYNYVFDPKVYFRSFFEHQRGDYAFLIDEAHNLVDRSRAMFSTELPEHEFAEASKTMRSYLPQLAKQMTKIARQISGQRSEAPSPHFSPPMEERVPDSSTAALFADDLFQSRRSSKRSAAPRSAFARKDAPTGLAPILRAFLTKAEEWLAQNTSAPFRDELLSLYFRVADFLRTFDLYDERYVTLVETFRDTTRLRLYCLDPASFLQAATRRGRSAIFFSATLSPMQYFRDAFGRDEADAVLRLPSPFPPENLRLLIADYIATDFKRRGATVEDVARAIGAVTQARQGNYLVYFPSYQYLNQVRQRFIELCPSVATLAQTSGMTEKAREEFLQAFRSDHQQTLVGFAVMGGIFGEGIDLGGERLVGAVVVGVGLPQLCLERDLIREHFDAKNGAGFEYAYAFPGLTRVCQASGRVIRSETDRGVVLLIDTRFAERRYRELLPPWWQPDFVGSPHEISSALYRFWGVEEI